MYHKGAINMNEHFSGVQVKNTDLMDRFPRTALCCWTKFKKKKSYIHPRKHYHGRVSSVPRKKTYCGLNILLLWAHSGVV